MLPLAIAISFTAAVGTNVLSDAQSASSRPQTQNEQLRLPDGRVWLGTVRIPARVLADGKPLAPGTYRVRLTGEHAEKNANGQLETLERWVEFVQGGEVKGRALAPTITASESGQVADTAPPRPGAARVERLREDKYYRVWFNHRGDQILIYLPMA
jgi:hypothetical protein